MPQVAPAPTDTGHSFYPGSLGQAEYAVQGMRHTLASEEEPHMSLSLKGGLRSLCPSHRGRIRGIKLFWTCWDPLRNRSHFRSCCLQLRAVWKQVMCMSLMASETEVWCCRQEEGVLLACVPSDIPSLQTQDHTSHGLLQGWAHLSTVHMPHTRSGVLRQAKRTH